MRGIYHLIAFRNQNKDATIFSYISAFEAIYPFTLYKIPRSSTIEGHLTVIRQIAQSLILLSLAQLLAGCTTNKQGRSPEVTISPDKAPYQQTFYGTRYYSAPADVVKHISGYRQSLVYEPFVVAESKLQSYPIASNLDPIIPAETHESSQKTTPHIHDITSDMWSRFCAGQSVTPDELTIINQSDLPSEWDGRCFNAK